MPRARTKSTGERLLELVEAAIVVFSRQGYEKSQIADVAKEMGVSVGTVYNYVESKEALFDLVLRHTSKESPAWLDEIQVPVRTPKLETTLGFLKGIFGQKNKWPVLSAALKQKEAEDPRAELESIIRELYALMHGHRTGLRLLLKSALSFPGMTEIFVFGLRKRLLNALVKYINLRVAAGQFAKPKDTFATASVITQTVAWANLQRPHDPHLSKITDAAVEEAILELMVNGLLKRSDIPKS